MATRPVTAELLLGLHLDRQAVAVPSEPALDPLAAHRPVARHGVFHEAGEEMAVVDRPVGERRAVVEHELVVRGPLLNRAFEGVLLLPRLDDRALDVGELRVLIDVGIALGRHPARLCRD